MRACPSRDFTRLVIRARRSLNALREEPSEKARDQVERLLLELSARRSSVGPEKQAKVDAFLALWTALSRDFLQ